MEATQGNKEFVVALAEVVDILASAFNSANNIASFLRRFGWDVEVDETEFNAFEAAINFGPILASIHNSLEQINDGNSDQLELVEKAIGDLESLFNLISNLSSTPPNGLTFPFNQQEFWDQMSEDLVDYIIIDYIDSQLPLLYSMLFALGIFEKEEIIPTEVVNERITYIRYTINWNALPQIITDPISLLEETYNWGKVDSAFNFNRFNEAFISLFTSSGITSTLELPKTSFLDVYYDEYNPIRRHLQQLEVPLYFAAEPDWSQIYELGITITPITAKLEKHGAPVGFVIAPLVTGNINAVNNDSDDYLNMYFKGGFDSEGLFAFEFRPEGFDLTLGGSTDVDAELGLMFNPPDPKILIGNENSPRLEIDGFVTSIGVKGDIADPEFIFTIGTDAGTNKEKIRLVLLPSNGDSFLNKIMGNEDIEIEFSTYMRWSSKTGLTFSGSAALEFEIPLHLDILFLEILKIGFRAGVSSNNGIQFELNTSFNTNLGPLRLSVEEIGASLALEPKSDKAGFAGLEPNFGFSPPRGVGLQIDTSAVKGGGFLYIDVEKGEYAGVAELTIQNMISLKAIGIINTKLPNGEEGFALLLLITAEFTPVQLGFGFTLNGVGGLIGANRGMNLPAIRDGVRNDTLDHILFPDDPVANAPAIISNLNTIFPIVEENHSFGIMGIIGWGVPTLLEVELGLMITFPSFDLAVIGKVFTALPDKNAAILKLNVAFAGTMSFEKKYFYFDAAIFDSKLLTYSLSGQMALRILWGDEPNFVLSVGGFNPDFVPPPLELNDLERITLNLLADDNPRLVLQTYFAVTSNTVQFGASIDFLFKVSKFKVVGYFYFHALFQFDPFYFKVSIGAGLAVKLGSSTILSVSVSGSLEGPTPWKAKGKGKFKVLFVKFSVSFSETWGETLDTSLPGIEVFPKLREAILDDRNWTALLPQHSTLTTLRDIVDEGNDAPEQLTIHPFGSLSILQRVVPLEETIDLFGNQEPSDYNRFKLSLKLNNQDLGTSDKRDFFAPAQFFELSDAEKISKDAYVKFRAGLAAKTTENLSANHHVNRVVEYELEVLDSKDNPPKKGVYIQSAGQMAHWAKGAAIAKSELGILAERQILENGKSISFQEEKFVIVNQSDLSPVESIAAGTEIELQTMLNNMVLENPEKESELMVVSSFEIL